MHDRCRRSSSASRACGVHPFASTSHARHDAEDPASHAVRRDGDRIVLSGELRTSQAAAIWKALRAAARDVRAGATIEIDLSTVPAVDGNIMALLAVLRGEMVARGARVELSNAGERIARIAELYAVGAPPAATPRRRRPSALAELGAATLGFVDRVREGLGFLGTLAIAACGGRRHHRPTARVRQFVSIIEETGADAMTIVFAILFVVGFIFSYATADQFIRLGQRLLSPRLTGRAMAREIAPVMTAIILSGRSGAAFAAELGAMTINREIDALRTLGLDPFVWLVVPRAVALVVVLPALAIAGAFFGVAGGALVGLTNLGLHLQEYGLALKNAVSPWDVAGGLIKSAAFGLSIALIACRQGFAASGGPEDVGRRTTSAVVSCLFVVIVIDALFTVIYRSFGG